jgi:hypothetical protein
MPNLFPFGIYHYPMKLLNSNLTILSLYNMNLRDRKGMKGKKKRSGEGRLGRGGKNILT